MNWTHDTPLEVYADYLEDKGEQTEAFRLMVQFMLYGIEGYQFYRSANSSSVLVGYNDPWNWRCSFKAGLGVPSILTKAPYNLGHGCSDYEY